MKSRFSIFSLIMVLAMIVSACAVPVADAPAEGDAEMASDSSDMAMAGDVVELEFWHAMSGELGELVDELVARFNESQDGIMVTATHQGSYDDTYNALLAAMETGGIPNIIQNFDIASQTMFDTGLLIPAHQLMDADGYDSDIFIPAVRDYYSDDQGMVAMAFNSSTPILYYNVDMLAEAGIESIDGSLSFSEFKAMCDQIQAAGVSEYCFTFGQVGWFFEQTLANSGGLYFNENNGRTGRATEAVFNQGAGVEVFEFYTSLIQEGYAPNLASTWSETDSTFQAGQAAIMIDSTSDVKIIENSEFAVSTAFIPHADSSERNGVIIGGAALWLLKSEDAAQNDAAWQFMKFMAEGPQQITWHTGSGYFPVRTDISDDAELVDFWDQNPNFVTAIEQLSTTETMIDGNVNYAVLGGRAGPFPAIRRLIVEAYSRVLDDDLSAQEALDEAAEKANEELANYNAFFE
ncbi:MAG: ABC transporter substrate-binding protein [Chloroflexota bacterium]